MEYNGFEWIGFEQDGKDQNKILEIRRIKNNEKQQNETIEEDISDAV